MSDRDLRRILHDIIDDFDAGRLRLKRPRRLVKWLGGPVLAVSLGLGAAGCDDRALGYTDDAGTEQVDAGASEDYAAPPVDAGSEQVDAGPVWAYGIPPIDDDAGVTAVDAGSEEWDGGAFDLYGVPFDNDDAGVDPGSDGLYSVPPVPPED